MKIYKRFIKPMKLVSTSSQDYTPKKIPIESEEKWYPEEEQKNLEYKYGYLNNKSFSDLVFDDKYEEVEIIRCKDCDHVCDYSDIYKNMPFKCTISRKFHNADWFCADGECNEGR